LVSGGSPGSGDVTFRDSADVVVDVIGDPNSVGSLGVPHDGGAYTMALYFTLAVLPAVIRLLNVLTGRPSNKCVTAGWM
jgi:hypothetical protein